MKANTALPQSLAPVLSQSVFLQPLPVSNVKTNYKSKASKVLSILQIVGGILIMVFGLGTALPVFDMLDGHLVQLLSGAAFDMILLVICGGIGIGASKKKTSCLIISHMVLCILASICVFSHVFQSVTTVLRVADRTYDRDYYSDDSREYRDYIDYPEGTEMPWGSGDGGSSPIPIPVNYHADDYDTMDSYMLEPEMVEPSRVSNCFGGPGIMISYISGGVLILLCVMEFIVCVWGSALACKVTCCCGANTQNHMHVNPGFQYGQIDPANPHVVVINGQGYPVAPGPVVTPSLAAPLTKEQEALGIQVGSGQPTLQTPPPKY